MGGGEESEVTKVDESALSGFGGDYDYDYDYYDEEEVEITTPQADTKQKDVVLPDRKVKYFTNSKRVSKAKIL